MSRKKFYYVDNEPKMFSDDQVNWNYGVLMAIEENTLWKFVDNTCTNYKYCRDETSKEMEERIKRAQGLSQAKESICMYEVTNDKHYNDVKAINRVNTKNINEDVDMIYELAFSEIVEDIKKGTWGGDEYSKLNCLGTTGILTSSECIQAHKLNPMKIITTEGNAFYPYGVYGSNMPSISFSLNKKVLDFIKKFGTIMYTLKNIPFSLKTRFMADISPARIKGSIHHELTHWLDDTFHNNHSYTKKNFVGNGGF